MPFSFIIKRMNEVTSLAIKKRIQSAKNVSKIESVFKCPVCDSPMEVFQLESLICLKGHTFDFAKQGYLNLMMHPVKSKYNMKLFRARKKIIAEAKFFEKLHQKITKVLNPYSTNYKEKMFLLDTGCGEGSHLSAMCTKLRSDSQNDVVGIGIDLSKEGIYEAAKSYTDNIWTVADLVNLPFKSGQVDVILNILSPSNYAEFGRVLKADGLLVKVVPKEKYLKELRENLFNGDEKQSYSNDETVKRFKENFRLVRHTSLNYSFQLDKKMAQSFLQMTPLTWGMSKEEIQALSQKCPDKITVDLDVLVGIRPDK